MEAGTALHSGTEEKVVGLAWQNHQQKAARATERLSRGFSMLLGHRLLLLY